MTKVYIIEQGSYSGYRVVGIYSTKANAEQALRYINDDSDYEPPVISERVLDPAIAELNEGLTQYIVRLMHNGEITIRAKPDLQPDDMHWGQNGVYHVWARDSDHALKIAAERHAQWQLEPRP